MRTFLYCIQNNNRNLNNHTMNFQDQYNQPELFSQHDSLNTDIIEDFEDNNMTSEEISSLNQNLDDEIFEELIHTFEDFEL